MDEIICPKCGHANSTASIFCGNCGSRLAASVQGTQSPVPPMPPQLPQNPFPPMPAGSPTTITVERSSQWTNSLRAIKIVLDSFEIAEVHDGQVITLPIAPGNHTIFVKVDFITSRVIPFFQPAAANKVFRISSPVQGAKMFIPGYTTVAMFSQDGWLTLDQIA
jgi:hypothetical protein